METEAEYLVIENTDTEMTKEQLRDSFLSLTGVIQLSIADFISEDGGLRVAPNQDQIEQFDDKTGNDWYWLRNSSGNGATLETNVLNGKSSMLSNPTAGTTTYYVMNVLNAAGLSWASANFGFLSHTGSSGATVMMMLQPVNGGGVSFAQHILLTNTTDYGVNNVLVFRKTTANDNMMVAHGRNGGSNWYQALTNSSNNFFVNGTPCFVIFRWDGTRWTVDNCLGIKTDLGAPDNPYDATGDLNSHVQLFGSGSTTWDKYEGHLFITAFAEGYLSDAELNLVLADVNTYYNTSFALTP